MPSVEESVQLYLQLVEHHEKQGHSQERDRFLLLAADAALTSGRTEQAERLRRTLLERNPHHMLKPYRSLAEALQADDVRAYVEQLRQKYPPREALLQSSAKKEGETGFAHESDEEFSLPLDLKPEKLDEDVPLFLPEPEPPRPAKKEPPVADFAPPFSTPGRRPESADQPAAAGAKVFNLLPAQEVDKRRARRGTEVGPVIATDDTLHPGAWVGTALFAIALAAGFALLVYAIVMPLVK